MPGVRRACLALSRMEEILAYGRAFFKGKKRNFPDARGFFRTGGRSRKTRLGALDPVCVQGCPRAGRRVCSAGCRVVELRRLFVVPAAGAVLELRFLESALRGKGERTCGPRGGGAVRASPIKFAVRGYRSL